MLRVIDIEHGKEPITAEEKERLEKEMIVLIEENKGLRKGLQEILDFLKDNSMYLHFIV